MCLPPACLLQRYMTGFLFLITCNTGAHQAALVKIAKIIIQWHKHLTQAAAEEVHGQWFRTDR